MPLLDTLLQTKEKKIFMQMGGQGTPWYRELKKIYDTGEYGEYFFHTFDALREIRYLIDNTVALPKGLDLESWLKDENTVPDEEYLNISAVSLIAIQITQLAYYEMFRKKYPFSVIHPIVAGATGHSQGLISMTLAGLGLEEERYYEALRFYTKYITHLAIFAQESFPYLELTQEEKELAAELQQKEVAPMVAVLGSTHRVIEELVEKFHEKYPGEKKIQIGLYNTPTNRILSSYRKSLLLFYKENRSFFEQNRIKFIFLRTTCPFHSSYMEEAYKRTLDYLSKEKILYGSKDLKFPLYSFFSGEDYRHSDNYIFTMTKDLLVNTLYWEKALLPAVQSRVDYILDFGPGKTSQRLSEENLEAMQANIPVLSLANPKDQKEIL